MKERENRMKDLPETVLLIGFGAFLLVSAFIMAHGYYTCGCEMFK